MKSRSTTDILLPISVAMILPIIGIYSNPDEIAQNKYGFLIRWLFSSTILYTFWHVTWYFSSNRFKDNRWSWLAAILIIIVLYALRFFSEVDIDRKPFARTIFALALILIIQYTARAQRSISLLQLEKEQIQTENYKAQLEALHKKIDPHFLFNSMNTLRSMVRQGHDNSEKFIISLSDFYRQTLKHTDDTTT